MTSVSEIFAGWRRLLPYILVIIVVNIFLLTLPLFNMPGFEFSFVNALLLFLISGIYTIKLFSKGGVAGEKIVRPPYLILLIFLLLPLTITLVHALFGMLCSLSEGLLFYLVITVPSVFIGFSIGIFCVAHIKKFRVYSFILIFLLIIAVSLAEFYFNPQVYFFNPVFGYFPGTIYDEGIKIGEKLVTYRLFNVVYFGVAAFLSWKLYLGNKGLKRWMSVITLSVAGLLFIFTSPYLGYSTTGQSLRTVLPKEIETEHFNIFFPGKLTDKRAEEISIEHEYQFHKLVDFFGFKPSGRITSYVFSDNSEKGKYFGSANADVAKPWLRQIYISLDSYGQTLRHELAHVFSERMGTGILKVASGFNPALIEGIAVAADPYFGDNTVDYMAALAYRNGFKIKIDRLFSGMNFFGRASSVSYIYAGSFTRFIVKKYGISPYAKFYAGGKFEQIYGIDLKVAAGEYYKYLESVDLKDGSPMAYYYFGRQTIFQKVCPRYIADRLDDGWKAYGEKSYAKSVKIFREILGKTSNYSAVSGLAENYISQKKYAEAAGHLEKWIGKFENTAYYYNLEFKLADSYALAGKGEKADSLYGTLVNQKPNRTLRYLAEMRTTLAGQPGLLKDYLEGKENDKYDMLARLNSRKYYYSSLPVLINLADMLNIKYQIFIREFEKKLEAGNYAESYAVFRLSEYMLKNSDFDGAVKMAGLATKFNGDENFNEILKRNFDKSIWIDYNASRILGNLKIKYSE